MKRHEISDLIAVSRRYGGDSRFVLLGGGNTSQKIGDVMYVKASGCALGTIAEDGFVAMSLPRLQEIWEKTYPANVDEREKLVLQDMMATIGTFTHVDRVYIFHNDNDRMISRNTWK